MKLKKIQKKIYRKPLILKHGDIKELTKSNMDDGTDLDGGISI